MSFLKTKESGEAQVDFDRLPRHVAIIMDGNGRWAKRRGLPRTAGHAAGAIRLLPTSATPIRRRS